MKTESKFIVDYDKMRDYRERFGMSANDLSLILLTEYNYRCSFVNIYRLEKDGELNKTQASSILIKCLADLYSIPMDSLLKLNPNYVRKTAKDNIMPQSQVALSKSSRAKIKGKNVIKIKEPVF